MTDEEQLERLKQLKNLVSKVDVYQLRARDIGGELLDCRTILNTVDKNAFPEGTLKSMFKDLDEMTYHIDEADSIARNMKEQLWDLWDQAGMRL